MTDYPVCDCQECVNHRKPLLKHHAPSCSCNHCISDRLYGQSERMTGLERVMRSNRQHNHKEVEHFHKGMFTIILAIIVATVLILLYVHGA